MPVAVVVTFLVLAPLGFLIIRAIQVGWSELSTLLFRHLTAVLLWNTARLTVVVSALCAVIGVGAAWCIERTDLPGRRVLGVLVVLPVAIPDFVVSFGWVSVAPAIHGFLGAVLVMTLAVYPLVYLPVAASLRNSDPAQEEVARSLGAGRWESFRRVTLRQIRPALLGGCLLVALAILAEYGAFEILRYQTFTTEIFTEFQEGFNAPAASALSLILVLLGLAVLISDGFARDRGRLARVDRHAARTPRPRHLGGAVVPVSVGLWLLVGLALGVPVGTLVYWMLRGSSTTLPAAASLLGATLHTAGYSASAAVVSTAMALPVAVLGARRPGRATATLERANFLIQALPGLVVALALVFFSVRYAAFLYQSPVLLVFCYSVLFFPLALVCVRASVAQVPRGLEDVARSLGQGRLAVWWRVSLPLVAPGLAAGACLVFLSAVTELTATLVLIPTNTETLATQFWAFTGNLSYGAAAPYAAVMVAIAVGPSYVLGRWFDRRPTSAALGPAATGGTAASPALAGPAGNRP
ncbi:MAG TPA: iron ABC transporter permease [Acidimicrobiales bacterium]|nr:iron ABC transporter permease [Acidimicrobiales bacterium]